MAVPNSAPPLLLDDTSPHAPAAVGATRIMLACADLELCRLPNRPLGEKDGHGCRLGCGGRLHGICGEPEEEGGREIHRVCNPRIAKKQKTPDSSNQPKPGCFSYSRLCVAVVNSPACVEPTLHGPPDQT